MGKQKKRQIPNLSNASGVVDRWRNRVQGLDLGQWALPAVIGGGLLLAILWGLSRSGNNIDPQVLQITIDAASTRAYVGVGPLIDNLSQTPPEAVLTGAAPTLSLAGEQSLQQFAASAIADSQFDDLESSSAQATGPPNTEKCGDFRTAWATAQPSTQGTLTVYFPQLVKPIAFQVHQSYNPGYITLITMTDIYGEIHTIYEASPQLVGACPYVLVVLITGPKFVTNSATIYIDQTAAPEGRTEIDAVELIGAKY